ncbi:MarR family winged helix-turn-helix transcriptional regulator [Streptomyces sp. bgisy022]|uniref:MarR family winged helix-turn-helix transcriptional regulator n=1 Tax=Streptomyces sp. bgisy022 TaxID=3413769 RepID=UPI003D72E40E
MAAQAQYEELVRQFSAFGAVKREMRRLALPECPSGSAAVLALLGRHGDMRMGRMAELLAVDMSVTSRHVAQAADRGWLERLPDPADKRSRILRLTPSGRDQLDEVFRHTTRLLAERLADWSDDDVTLLAHLMARLRDSFDDCRTGSRPPASPPRQAAPGSAPTTRTPAST